MSEPSAGDSSPEAFASAAATAPSGRGKRIYDAKFLLSLRREQTWEELEDVPAWARDEVVEALAVPEEAQVPTAPSQLPCIHSHADAPARPPLSQGLTEADEFVITREAPPPGLLATAAGGGGGRDMYSMLEALAEQLHDAPDYFASRVPVDLTLGGGSTSAAALAAAPAAAVVEEEEEDFEFVTSSGGGAGGGGELGSLLATLTAQLRTSSLATADRPPLGIPETADTDQPALPAPPLPSQLPMPSKWLASSRSLPPRVAPQPPAQPLQQPLPTQWFQPPLPTQPPLPPGPPPAPNGAAGGLDALLASLGDQLRQQPTLPPPQAPLLPARQHPLPLGPPAAPSGAAGGLDTLLAALGTQLQQQQQLMHQQELLTQMVGMMPPPPLAPPPPPTANDATQHLSALLGIGGGPGGGAGFVGGGGAGFFGGPLAAQPPAPPPRQQLAPMYGGAMYGEAAIATSPATGLAGGWAGGLGSGGPNPQHAGGRSVANARDLDTFGASDEVFDLSMFAQQTAAFQHDRAHPGNGHAPPRQYPLPPQLPSGQEPPNWQQQLFGRQL